MAVTDYYTANGRIRGQATAGARLNYMPDPLGSVTQTVDESGSVENTYRYKPYGTIESKSGIGQDPRFLWNGARGDSTSETNYANIYGMTQYNSSSATYVITLPQFLPNVTNPIFSQKMKEPCGNDYTGPPWWVHAIYHSRGTIQCLHAFWSHDWSLPPAPPGLRYSKNGAVIQEIHVYCSAFNCKTSEEAFDYDHYLEAWHVRDGKPLVPVDFRDHWGFSPGINSDCTRARYQSTGYFAYFDNCLVGEGTGWHPPPDPNGEAGHLWTYRPPISGFMPRNAQQNKKFMKAGWDCCVEPEMDYLTIAYHGPDPIHVDIFNEGGERKCCK